MLAPHNVPLLAAFGAQVPPAPVQDWQDGQEVEPQQWPSTQLPPVHSLLVAQAEPRVDFGTHDVPEQRKPLAQLESEAHVGAKQAEPLAHRTFPGQSVLDIAEQVAEPLQAIVVRLPPLQIIPQISCGSIPFKTGAQVPSGCLVSACVQALQPLQSLSQQTPSEHWPLAHSVPLVHDAP